MHNYHVLLVTRIGFTINEQLITCWIVFLQLRHEEPTIEVLIHQSLHKKAVSFLGHTMVSNLPVTEENELVEHVEYFKTRLMDGKDDCPVGVG